MIGKSIFFAIAFALAAPAIAADAPATGPFHFDRGHTYINFTIDHFGFSVAHGAFTAFEPVIAFDPAKPEETKIEVTIDAASIDTAWPARDEELRGEHFFNVAKFPTITYRSTMVERTGETTAKLTGNITLLGVTKPLVFDVKLNKRGPHAFRPSIEVVGFAATGVLKRSEFGMTALLPGLADDVQLTIGAEINNSVPKPKT
ncbi:MAG: YceI family protein [Alphaproteobacteria bacterium]